MSPAPLFAIGYCHAGAVRGTFLSSMIAFFRSPGAAYCERVIDAAGPYIHINRNNIVREFLRGDADWLLFVDIDMVFTPLDVMALVGAAQTRRIAAGLYDTIICGTRMPCWFSSLRPPQAVAPIPDAPTSIASCGMGFTVIHREVFLALGDGWFDHARMETLDGEYAMAEDASFCDRALAHGFPIWGIPSVRLGHDKTQVIYPAELQ